MPDAPPAPLWKPWRLVLTAFVAGVSFAVYLAVPGALGYVALIPMIYTGYSLVRELRRRRDLRKADASRAI